MTTYQRLVVSPAWRLPNSGDMRIVGGTRLCDNEDLVGFFGFALSHEGFTQN